MKRCRTGYLRGVCQLADASDLLPLPPTPETDPSPDALRIQNELNLCFNRPDINPDYMKTLIFAAAERYAVLPDLMPSHDMEVLRERLKAGPANDSDLRELLAKAVAVKVVRIGGPNYIELELTNGQIIEKE